jgi:hypothetical protein
MSMEIALDIWKWQFPWLFAFSACRLEMISSSLLEIEECAISNVQLLHPYGDGLRWTSPAGPGRRASGRLRLDPTSRELTCRRTHSDLGVVLLHSE